MAPARRQTGRHPSSQRPTAILLEVGSEEEEKIKEIYKELGLKVWQLSKKSRCFSKDLENFGDLEAVV